MGTRSYNGSGTGGGRLGAVLLGAGILGVSAGLAIGLQPWRERGEQSAAEAPRERPAAENVKTVAAPRAPGPSALDIRPLPKAPVEIKPQSKALASSNLPALPVRKYPLPKEEPRIASLAKPTATPSAHPEAHDRQQRPRELDRTAIADRLDQIERLRISAGDIKLLKEAVRLFYKERMNAGKPLIARIQHSVARRMARWYYLRASRGHAKLSEFVKFRRNHPMWPNQRRLRRNAELSALLKQPPHDNVLAFFEEHSPVTGAGKAALGAAYLAKGDKSRGTALIREAWRNHALEEKAEEAVRERFDRLLRKQDHKARADWLLAQDRRSLTDDARRLKKELDKLDRASLEARVAEVRRSRRAGGLLTRLDKAVKTRPEVLLSRVRWLRRHGNDEKAWRLMKKAPVDAEALIDPNAWWKERRIQTRRALNAGKAKTAYVLARDHGGATGEDLHEAEFLAGWLALRFLDDAEAAKKHFTASRKGADLPADFARSDYWRARAELKLGRTVEAKRWFLLAVRHFHTYYGQLARLALGPEMEPISVQRPARPTWAEMESFVERDIVQALPISRQAGFDSFLTVFIYQFARKLESPGEMTLAAELAKRIAPPNAVVRFGKIALNRGFPVGQYAYPTDIPEFEMLSGARPVERALMLSLARQESEFNPKALSSAGARGLMQLMPATARMVARINQVSYRLSRLNNPEYNAKLGSFYMRRLLDRFSQSYVMMLAGYNAGPGRVSQWIDLFGDPRRSSIDPVDWVERIPFTQTRVYVHKIMESLQVYRALLNEKQARENSLAADLHRGRRGAQLVPIYSGSAIN